MLRCFFTKAFYKNKKNCRSRESLLQPTPMPTSFLAVPCQVADDFKEQILSKFIRDRVGISCQTDETLVSVGQKLYYKVKAKRDKKTEVRRTVMCDLRRLGGLFVCFAEEFRRLNGSDEVEVKDMVHRRNFPALEVAIQHYTTSESGMKASLKVSIYYLLKKLAKVVKSTYLVSRNDAAAAEVDRFVDVLTLNYNFLFGDAIYHVNQNRQVKLRKPEQLPRHDDVQRVKQYTVNQMDMLLKDEYLQWTASEFIQLRDLADCRLTLFNARREGEPARLTVDNWMDARNNVWLNQDRLVEMDEVDKNLFRDMKVMYQSGKGNHLVPVLVPKDTENALEKLCDIQTREDCSILPSNHYLFPSTQSSAEHIYGWYAVHKVCVAAGVEEPDLLTATKMRHRVSTLYASLEVPESQRSHFYKHMGHSANINASVYQAPLAEIEITQVGKVLKALDDQPSSMEELQSAASSSANRLSATRNRVCVVKPNTPSSQEVVLEHMPEDNGEYMVQVQDDRQDNAISEDNSICVVKPNTPSSQEVVLEHIPEDNGVVREKTRKFTRWASKETARVTRHFKMWIDGTRAGLPGKKDICEFKDQTGMTYDWQTIRNKVLNEKMAFNKRLQKRLPTVTD